MASLDEYFEIKQKIDRNRNNFILKEDFEELTETYLIPEQVKNMEHEEDLLFLTQYKDELLTKTEHKRLENLFFLPFELKCLELGKFTLDEFISAVRFVKTNENTMLIKKSVIKGKKALDELKEISYKSYDVIRIYAKLHKKERTKQYIKGLLGLIGILVTLINFNFVSNFTVNKTKELLFAFYSNAGNQQTIKENYSIALNAYKIADNFIENKIDIKTYCKEVANKYNIKGRYYSAKLWYSKANSYGASVDVNTYWKENKMALVEKGSNSAGTIEHSFYIGRYEVNQEEFRSVMGYNPSSFGGDNLPVEKVNWYHAVEYCNKLSVREHLEPVYMIDKINKDPESADIDDDLQWTVKTDFTKNGYRLPTIKEWEYAAAGGIKSKNYQYSGSNSINDVAWYETNSRYSSHKIESKLPNELGIYDMSGNVQEWCWDGNGSFRNIRGGSWNTNTNKAKIKDIALIWKFYSSFYTGFRVVRNY